MGTPTHDEIIQKAVDYRYIERIIGKECAEALKSFEVGECIYQFKGKTVKLKVPLYGLGV